MADFTVADVLAWAKTKPAGGTYSYADCRNCAMCQFLRETGRAVDPRVAPSDWYEADLTGGRRQYPGVLEYALGNSSQVADLTFGAMVIRLEQTLAEQVAA